jgi:ATP-dependent Clp protease adaptor protein ClpS
MENTSTQTAPRPDTRTSTRPRPKQPPLWNVVLLDDDEHTYEYVVEMMQLLFAHPMERAFTIARRVDKAGRAVCFTTHREHAELKLEQVRGYGKDPLLSESRGSMRALIEPAESGDEPG